MLLKFFLRYLYGKKVNSHHGKMKNEEFKLYFSFSNLFIYNSNFSESFKTNSKGLRDNFCLPNVAEDSELL